MADSRLKITDVVNMALLLRRSASRIDDLEPYSFGLAIPPAIAERIE
jgi:hypothetical protein